MSTDPVLALWREICEDAPACIDKGRKHLLICEADLIRMGATLEALQEVGRVDSRGSWPRGDLNEAGRALPHNTPLYAFKKPK